MPTRGSGLGVLGGRGRAVLVRLDEGLGVAAALGALATAATADTMLLALDFDGTLAPFTEDPADSRPLPAARDALDALAGIAVDLNSTVENIGARRLSTVMERLLEELSFSAPNLSGQTRSIDGAQVDTSLGELARNEDLSRFIL